MDHPTLLEQTQWKSKASGGEPVIKQKNLHFSTKEYFVGTQKNRLNETVLLSTHKICLN